MVAVAAKYKGALNLKRGGEYVKRFQEILLYVWYDGLLYQQKLTESVFADTRTKKIVHISVK